MIAITSPPDRERLVVELLADHVQFAEIDAEAGHLAIEIYPRPNGDQWTFDLGELTTALERGAAILSERLGLP